MAQTGSLQMLPMFLEIHRQGKGKWNEHPLSSGKGEASRHQDGARAGWSGRRGGVWGRLKTRLWEARLAQAQGGRARWAPLLGALPGSARGGGSPRARELASLLSDWWHSHKCSACPAPSLSCCSVAFLCVSVLPHLWLKGSAYILPSHAPRMNVIGRLL